MKLTNGTHTVEVKSPTAVNNLKAQGYREEKAERSKSSPRTSAPRTEGEDQ